MESVMCGIVGGVSGLEIAPILIEGLRRLEYRGYDSAGIAIIDNNLKLQRLRALGKVNELAECERNSHLEGKTGIAHTRWATHGQPSEVNAHPHTSSDQIAVVHNGIIENHQSLKNMLIERGYEFSSQTDSEVCAHLIHLFFEQQQDLLKAVQLAAQQMEGAFAIGVIHNHMPTKMIALRKGSPLVIGLSSNGNYIASDPLALQNVIEQVIYLEENDIAQISIEQVEIFDANGEPQQRQPEPLPSYEQQMSKGKYRHFMLKEIYEQPRAIADTLQGRLTEKGVFKEIFGQDADQILTKVENIHIVACGTSYHAGLVAKYWIEQLCQIPCSVEVASEYRYRSVIVPSSTLFITVSQSGETADTLAALRKAKELNYLSTLGICNVPTSTLVRETELVFLTRAGVEIGVASTKAFTTQLCAFMLLSLNMSKATADQNQQIVKALLHMPRLCEELLALDNDIQHISRDFIEKDHALFLGRGTAYPVALEGALKLKEISYIHAEAYPAGELKHGPLALVDADMPVVAVAPNDQLLDKLKSNLEEVRARGGELYIFADNAAQLSDESGIHVINIPNVPTSIAPIVYTLPLQLLAYHVAVLKGTDVDQPRNLAKSVTVE
jgi:glucosamine--fructose-6-phosphate aminotransferase (isomerizing)